jgi:dihydrofolate synthase/folylpolyglutamate synthase
VVIGESHPETDPVFERKVLYTNLSDPSFMGNREQIMSLLTFADKTLPAMWDRHDEILAQMDLQGSYQVKNLRTVLTALQVLGGTCSAFDDKLREVSSNSGILGAFSMENCARGIINTARRTGFRGRWEKLSDSPLTICDIGHNEHGLRHNFAQLSDMKLKGQCSELIIVYGSVADKDVDAVLHLMPEDAIYIFTQAKSKRALAADIIFEKYTQSRGVSENIHVYPDVTEAIRLAYDIAENKGGTPLVYIGGSTYVVSEAVALYK